MTTALAGLPARVEVDEVRPRDGLQDEPAVVPVEVAQSVRQFGRPSASRTVTALAPGAARTVPTDPALEAP